MNTQELNAKIAADKATASAASEISKDAAATSLEAEKIAQKSKLEALKDQASQKISDLKEKTNETAAKHNIDLGAIKEKAKELTADGLEGVSKLADKLSGSAHNASQKLSK